MLLWALVACGHPIGTDSADTAAEAWDFDHGAFLYGEHTLDFDLALDDSALAALAADPKTDVHGTFTWDGESYDVGVHLKGSPSGSFRDMTGKASFKIDFHQWDPEASFHGVRRLTLNSMVQDGTMTHEHAVYKLMADVDVPSPRHGYAKVTVNGELFGLYGVVESMDEQFINRHWDHDDTGNLYEGGYGADFVSGRTDNFDQHEVGEPADRSDLTALIDAIEAAPSNGALALIESRFNADALFHMWAVELLTADIDGYSTGANNFLLYHAPVADQWTMIPWGPDQAFEQDFSLYITESVYGFSIGRLTTRCHDDPACLSALDSAMRDVLTTWQGGDFYSFVDDETARIESDCRTDPRSAWGDYGCRDAQAAMRDWVRARPAVAEPQIGSY